MSSSSIIAPTALPNYIASARGLQHGGDGGVSFPPPAVVVPVVSQEVVYADTSPSVLHGWAKVSSPPPVVVPMVSLEVFHADTSVSQSWARVSTTPAAVVVSKAVYGHHSTSTESWPKVATTPADVVPVVPREVYGLHTSVTHIGQQVSTTPATVVPVTQTESKFSTPPPPPVVVVSVVSKEVGQGGGTSTTQRDAKVSTKEGGVLQSGTSTQGETKASAPVLPLVPVLDKGLDPREKLVGRGNDVSAIVNQRLTVPGSSALSAGSCGASVVPVSRPVVLKSSYDSERSPGVVDFSSSEPVAERGPSSSLTNLTSFAPAQKGGSGPSDNSPNLVRHHGVSDRWFGARLSGDGGGTRETDTVSHGTTAQPLHLRRGVGDSVGDATARNEGIRKQSDGTSRMEDVLSLQRESEEDRVGSSSSLSKKRGMVSNAESSSHLVAPLATTAMPTQSTLADFGQHSRAPQPLRTAGLRDGELRYQEGGVGWQREGRSLEGEPAGSRNDDDLYRAVDSQRRGHVGKRPREDDRDPHYERVDRDADSNMGKRSREGQLPVRSFSQSQSTSRDYGAKWNYSEPASGKGVVRTPSSRRQQISPPWHQRHSPSRRSRSRSRSRSSSSSYESSSGSSSSSDSRDGRKRGRSRGRGDRHSRSPPSRISRPNDRGELGEDRRNGPRKDEYHNRHRRFSHKRESPDRESRPRGGGGGGNASPQYVRHAYRGRGRGHYFSDRGRGGGGRSWRDPPPPYLRHGNDQASEPVIIRRDRSISPLTKRHHSNSPTHRRFSSSAMPLSLDTLERHKKTSISSAAAGPPPSPLIVEHLPESRPPIQTVPHHHLASAHETTNIVESHAVKSTGFAPPIFSPMTHSEQHPHSRPPSVGALDPPLSSSADYMPSFPTTSEKENTRTMPPGVDAQSNDVAIGSKNSSTEDHPLAPKVIHVSTTSATAAKSSAPKVVWEDASFQATKLPVLKKVDLAPITPLSRAVVKLPVQVHTTQVPIVAERPISPPPSPPQVQHNRGGSKAGHVGSLGVMLPRSVQVPTLTTSKLKINLQRPSRAQITSQAQAQAQAQSQVDDRPSNDATFSSPINTMTTVADNSHATVSSNKITTTVIEPEHVVEVIEERPPAVRLNTGNNAKRLRSEEPLGDDSAEEEEEDDYRHALAEGRSRGRQPRRVFDTTSLVPVASEKAEPLAAGGKSKNWDVRILTEDKLPLRSMARPERGRLPGDHHRDMDRPYRHGTASRRQRSRSRSCSRSRSRSRSRTRSISPPIRHHSNNRRVRGRPF